jgi:hypothetical protein
MCRPHRKPIGASRREIVLAYLSLQALVTAVLGARGARGEKHHSIRVPVRARSLRRVCGEATGDRGDQESAVGEYRLGENFAGTGTTQHRSRLLV